MPLASLDRLLRQLPADSRTVRTEMGSDLHDWAHGLAYLNINMAHLVDLMQMWLDHEYAGWVADPDELEKERRRRKRAGIKPPPVPLIEPVAARPAEVHQQLAEVHQQQLVMFGQTQGPLIEQVTSEEFDRLLELD
jgi:hypothetical protein